MIQIYYGNGKGKTTASVGASIRAAGNRMKVLFVQFLKNGDSSECKILKQINNISYTIPPIKYKLFDTFDEEKKKLLVDSYTAFFNEVKASAHNYDMIVLDEIMDTVDFGILKEAEILSFLTLYKNDCEIILTGHKCSDKILSISDYVSEIKEIKHPYTKGQKARRGIEF